MVDKIKVAVLGATGIVGQRFVQLLSNHPWFEITYLAASAKHVGRHYGDIVRWVIGHGPSPEVTELVVGNAANPEEVPKDVEVVFSALPSSLAAEVEPELARRGYLVVSNASAFRLEPDVPLINPEVNFDHLSLIKEQKVRRGWSGAIIKDPNCTTAILTLSLAPLYKEFGIEEVIVTSMQAISGAGITGVPAYTITDNLIPYIPGEEEKVMKETAKILGSVEDGKHVRPAGVRVSAITTRVPVLDAHTIAVHVKLRREATTDDIVDALKKFTSLPQELGLPTAPKSPIVVREEVDRPQPRLDRYVGRGMSVVVGRIERPDILGSKWVKYVVLGHNTIRGAAGNAVLIAELVKIVGLRLS